MSDIRKFLDIVESMSDTDDKIDLNEALIVLGKQRYPDFNNVVIMAGGAGSGKGFVVNNLLGIEGYKFDTDDIKTMSLKSPRLKQRIHHEFGIDLEDMDLKNPDNVSKIHEIIDTLNIDNGRLNSLYKSIALSDSERKPNLIFDVTLKDLQKLHRISSAVKSLGYDTQNIHIVWVVNDIEVAKDQNLKRARTVPTEILVNTHRGVSMTMHSIITMGQDLEKYMDGDIVISFNKINVDTTLEKSIHGGKHVTSSDYFYIKRQGHGVRSLSDVESSVITKLRKYTPPGETW